MKTSVEVILIEKGFHVEGNAHNWSIHEITALGERCCNKKEKGSYIRHLLNPMIMNFTEFINLINTTVLASSHTDDGFHT
jgi:hypothetical protein